MLSFLDFYPRKNFVEFASSVTIIPFLITVYLYKYVLLNGLTYNPVYSSSRLTSFECIFSSPKSKYE